MKIESYQIPGFDRRIIASKEERILQSLLNAPHTRRDLDAIANTTGSPEYISRLRQRGVNIITERFKVTTPDGDSWPGCYTLHPDSRKLARKLIAGETVKGRGRKQNNHRENSYLSD